MKQSKIKEFFLSFKNSNKIYRYLFSLACLTCISVGWTSAKYTSEIYASSDSARSAKFSYSIENEVNNSGITGNLVDYESTRHVNKYGINTSDEKIQVIFSIKLKTEVAVNLKMRIDTTQTDFPLNVDNVKLTGNHVETIEVDGIGTNPKTIKDVISLDIEPFDGEREYECTVLLSHNGYDGKVDNYINLVPIINQID
ncbi:hypothetical protein [Enterococcus hulanensis]|uniref:hypothetical protein n=1 Tax=Enterococcus hulanensis TaxID=2559929 RepID=UPI0010F78F81|nr:hypothetical protein [Enterococcus hulanensis]